MCWNWWLLQGLPLPRLRKTCGLESYRQTVYRRKLKIKYCLKLKEHPRKMLGSSFYHQTIHQFRNTKLSHILYGVLQWRWAFQSLKKSQKNEWRIGKILFPLNFSSNFPFTFSKNPLSWSKTLKHNNRFWWAHPLGRLWIIKDNEGWDDS